MYFIVRFSILSKDKKKNKHRHRVDFLFEQTGIALLKNTEPKINYFFLKYTLISIISSFIIFMLWILFTEDIKDIAKAKKIKKSIQNSESRLRLNMYELADRMSADVPNRKLADQLIKSYQKNVTTFMRDMMSLVKRMK